MGTKSKLFNNKFANVIGWYGTGAIILAYLLVSFNAISAHSFIFQILNLTGALGIIMISAIKGVRQNVILNIFWAIIAAAALIKLFIN